jgi:hypothetical protein
MQASDTIPRGSGQASKGDGMKSDVLRRMDERGCDAGLRRLIEALPDDLPIVVNPGVGDFLPLAGGADCVAAIYRDTEHLHLLLTPQDGKEVADATGCKLTKSNQATGYLRILATEAADGRCAPLLQAATERAVRRSAGRTGGVPREDVRLFAHRRPQRMCPVSRLLVPTNGECDLHGDTCP